MGSYKAGQGLVILSIGQILFLAIILMSNSFFISVGSTGDLVGNSDFTDGYNAGSCENPRFSIDADSRELVEVSYFNRNSIACEYTSGQESQSSCNAIADCTWENSTIFWFFENTDVQECNGYVNMTQIGLVGEAIDLSGTLNQSLKAQLNNQDQCNFFGYTWVSFEEVSEEVELSTSGSVNLLWNNLKDLLTFQFDFGFTGDADYWFSIVFWLLNILIILHILFTFIPSFGE